MATGQGDRAATALRETLEDLRSVHSLLDDYEASGDKRKLTEVSLKMRQLLPSIKELSQDPECKTKANAPLLIELSNGMKEAVTRTKQLSASSAARQSLAASTSALPTATAASPVSLASSTSSLASSASQSPAVPPATISRHAASGWLNKLGDKGLIKSWKRRWFSQKAERLYYYEAKEETGLKGFIDLTLVTSVAETPKVKFGFELRTKDRIYYLQAASHEERSQWLSMLASWSDERSASPRKSVTSTGLGSPPSAMGKSGRSSTFIESEASSGFISERRDSGRATSDKDSTIPRSLSISSSRDLYPDIPRTTELTIERPSEPRTDNPPGATPSSLREDEIRQLQQKLLSLEAKLDTSASPVVKGPSLTPPSSSNQTSPTPLPSSNPTATSTPQSPSSSANAIPTIQSRSDSSPVAPTSSQALRDQSEERVRELEKRLAAADQEIQSLTSRLKHVKEKHASTKIKLKTAEQRIEGLTEDVTHLQKESRAKDEHIAGLKASAPSPSSAAPATIRELEDTIAQLRQATHAHQTQNAYLASEIKKLEREHGIELASRDEQISALRAQLEEQKTGPDHDHDTLQAEFAALQKLYFSALAVGIKLNLVLQGQPCNIDAASLWTKAQALNLHFSKWNEWVLARYEETFDD